MPDSCVEAKRYPLAVPRVRGGRKRVNLRERRKKLFTRLQHPEETETRYRTRVAYPVTAVAEQTPILQYLEEHVKDSRRAFSVSSSSTTKQGFRLTASTSRPFFATEATRWEANVWLTALLSALQRIAAYSSSSGHSVDAQTNSIPPRCSRLSGRPY